MDLIYVDQWIPPICTIASICLPSLRLQSDRLTQDSKWHAVQANRGEASGEIVQALSELPLILKHMGINSLNMSNVEADDIIATLAAHYSQTSKVTIYSADKVRTSCKGCHERWECSKYWP